MGLADAQAVLGDRVHRRGQGRVGAVSVARPGAQQLHQLPLGRQLAVQVPDVGGQVIGGRTRQRVQFGTGARTVDGGLRKRGRWGVGPGGGLPVPLPSYVLLAGQQREVGPLQHPGDR